MEAIHKEVLVSNWMFLLDNLELDELLDEMLAEHVITSDMYEQINIHHTRRERVTEFLSILMRRGPDAFTKFQAGLNKTSQSFICEKISETLNQGN